MNQFTKESRRVAEVKGLITKAFRVLRSKRFGMIARQRFSCCHSCAGYELADEIHTKVKAGKLDPGTFGGVVFTTKQDTMIERRRVRNLYLSFGPVTHDKTTYGPKTKAVGKAICQVFDEVGVPYEWDGDPMTSIKITPLWQHEQTGGHETGGPRTRWATSHGVACGILPGAHP